MFGHYAQVLVVALVAPGVRHPRRTDRRLTLHVVLLLPPYACPESTAHDLMALLLVRVEVLGDGEARREHDLDAQQLAVGLLGGFEEGCPCSEERSIYDISGVCHSVYSFPSTLMMPVD